MKLVTTIATLAVGLALSSPEAQATEYYSLQGGSGLGDYGDFTRNDSTSSCYPGQAYCECDYLPWPSCHKVEYSYYTANDMFSPAATWAVAHVRLGADASHYKGHPAWLRVQQAGQTVVEDHVPHLAHSQNLTVGWATNGAGYHMQVVGRRKRAMDLISKSLVSVHTQADLDSVWFTGSNNFYDVVSGAVTPGSLFPSSATSYYTEGGIGVLSDDFAPAGDWTLVAHSAPFTPATGQGILGIPLRITQAGGNASDLVAVIAIQGDQRWVTRGELSDDWSLLTVHASQAGSNWSVYTAGNAGLEMTSALYWDL